MKKVIATLLITAVICCLIAPTLGATASGDTEVINGNTYIYPKGFTDTKPEDLIITKPYTKEQIQQAEGALEPIFQSFYLSNDKALCDAISASESLQANCKHRNWTPDFSTLCVMYGFNNISAFPKTKTVSEALMNPPKIRYRLLTRSTLDAHGGDLHIDYIDEDYVVSGYGLFISAYITEDLRSHAVALYALLKDSGLDFTKTTVKFFQIGNIGRFYLFTDGKSEFVTPIGYQLDYSPYEAGEGYPDASSSFQLIRGEEFMKAMVKVEQEVAEAKAANASYDGEPQMGGSAIDNTPALNGNTVLYIAIGCFAVAAASVVVYLVIRKRRTLNKT